MARPLVLMPGPLHRSVPARLADGSVVLRLCESDDPAAFLAALGTAVAAIATGATAIDGAYLERLPNVQIVAGFGVGYEKMDASRAAERGVVVPNIPGVLDAEVADT